MVVFCLLVSNCFTKLKMFGLTVISVYGCSQHLSKCFPHEAFPCPFPYLSSLPLAEENEPTTQRPGFPGGAHSVCARALAHTPAAAHTERTRTDSAGRPGLTCLLRGAGGAAGPRGVGARHRTHAAHTWPDAHPLVAWRAVHLSPGQGSW